VIKPEDAIAELAQLGKEGWRMVYNEQHWRIEVVNDKAGEIVALFNISPNSLIEPEVLGPAVQHALELCMVRAK